MFFRKHPQAGRCWAPIAGLAAAWVVVAVLGAQRVSADIPARYQITGFGDLTEIETYGIGINDAGAVVGYAASTSGARLPVRWSNGVLTQLPSESGGLAYDINNQGQIVGHVGSALPQAVFFTEEGPQTLDTLGSAESVALGLNDSGQVVGSYRMPDSNLDLPYLWQNGTMAPLALPANTSQGEALGISNSGYIAGVAMDENRANYPVRWSPTGEPELLRGRNGALISGQVVGVNDAGDVAGSINTGDSQHAAIWRNGNLIELKIPNTTASHAFSVNNLGQVAVWALDRGISDVAYIWEDLNGNNRSDKGEAVKLSTLLPRPTEWRLQRVTAISDTGKIAGFGLYRGSVRGFVLEPLSAPRPDLTVSLGEITTTTVGRGRKRKPGLQMPVTVTNLGAKKVKFKKPLVVEYYFSTDDQLDAGDLRLGKSSVSGTLQAHPHPRDSKSFTAKVALPLDFDPSQLPEGYLLAKVDASDKVAESNEENNVGSQVLVIAD
ncbi:MAG: hypothetical protein ACK47B_21870 [Armatimonadota bacterium]